MKSVACRRSDVYKLSDDHKMSPSDFITQRQAAFGEFLDSSFLADVHIHSTGNNGSAVRLHSAMLAAASTFWRETFSDTNMQGGEMLMIDWMSDRIQ